MNLKLGLAVAAVILIAIGIWTLGLVLTGLVLLGSVTLYFSSWRKPKKVDRT